MQMGRIPEEQADRRASDPDVPAPFLRLLEVRKSFGGPVVLDGISLDILPGEFVTLLGPSGCGKTTLLRIIAGLEQADSGRILLDSADVSAMAAHRRPVNTVFQNYALFPHLNVFENVAFGLRSRGVERVEVRRRVDAALGMVQVGELAARRPDTLSGGQKQRVALARALVNEPKVLLMDEPMSALDAKLRAEVQTELRRLHRRLGTTFILVTHDQDEAMSVSDRIVVMNRGRMEQVGSAREVYDRPRTRFVAEFLGAANVLEAERVGPAGSSSVRTTIGQLEAESPPHWERGLVCVRPEHVRVKSLGDGGGAAHARVREVVYRGDHAEVWLDALDVRAKVAAAAAPRLGDTVQIGVDAHNVRVLDG